MGGNYALFPQASESGPSGCRNKQISRLGWVCSKDLLLCRVFVCQVCLHRKVPTLQSAEADRRASLCFTNAVLTNESHNAPTVGYLDSHLDIVTEAGKIPSFYTVLA
jgi:hypothetical protein